MPRPERHIFVCSRARPDDHPRGLCGARGCAAIAEEFWYQLQARDLFGRFQLTTTACIGPSGVGPNILIYPEGVMYSGIGKEPVTMIIKQHLLGGAPVAELLAPADMWS